MMDNLLGWDYEEMNGTLFFTNKEWYKMSIHNHYRWGNPNDPTGKFEVIVYKDDKYVKKFVTHRNPFIERKLKKILEKVNKIIEEYKKGL